MAASSPLRFARVLAEPGEKYAASHDRDAKARRLDGAGEKDNDGRED